MSATGIPSDAWCHLWCQSRGVSGGRKEAGGHSQPSTCESHWNLPVCLSQSEGSECDPNTAVLVPPEIPLCPRWMLVGWCPCVELPVWDVSPWDNPDHLFPHIPFSTFTMKMLYFYGMAEPFLIICITVNCQCQHSSAVATSCQLPLDIRWA